MNNPYLNLFSSSNPSLAKSYGNSALASSLLNGGGSNDWYGSLFNLSGSKKPKDDGSAKSLLMQQLLDQSTPAALADKYGTFKGQIDKRSDVEKSIGGIPVLGGILGTLGDASRAGGSYGASIAGDLLKFANDRGQEGAKNLAHMLGMSDQQIQNGITKGNNFLSQYINPQYTNPFQEALSAAGSPDTTRNIGDFLGVKNDTARGIANMAGSVAFDPTTYLGGAGIVGKLGKGAADVSHLTDLADALSSAGKLGKDGKFTYTGSQATKAIAGGQPLNPDVWEPLLQNKLGEQVAKDGLPLNPLALRPIAKGLGKAGGDIKNDLFDQLDKAGQGIDANPLIDQARQLLEQSIDAPRVYKKVGNTGFDEYTDLNDLTNLIHKNMNPQVIEQSQVSPRIMDQIAQQFGAKASDINTPNNLKGVYSNIAGAAKKNIDNLSGINISEDVAKELARQIGVPGNKQIIQKLMNIKDIQGLKDFQQYGKFLDDATEQGYKQALSKSSGGGIPVLGSLLNPVGDVLKGAVGPNINGAAVKVTLGGDTLAGLLGGAGKVAGKVASNPLAQLLSHTPVGAGTAIHNAIGNTDTNISPEEVANYLNAQSTGDDSGVQSGAELQQNAKKEYNKQFLQAVADGADVTTAKAFAESVAQAPSQSTIDRQNNVYDALTLAKQLQSQYKRAGGGQGAATILGSIPGINGDQANYDSLAKSSAITLAKALGGGSNPSEAEEKAILNMLPSRFDNQAQGQAKINRLLSMLMARNTQ